MESALEITSGQELLRFDLGTVAINRTPYTVLTGHEGTGLCFWCGGKLKGKLKRYCRGHMIEYYNYFEGASARTWCIERQEGRCANCGEKQGNVIGVNERGRLLLAVLEVHHIIPVDGGTRYFTAFNLPWNLIAFCHECHVEAHAAMRPERLPSDPWEAKMKLGQITLYPELVKKEGGG